MIRPESSPEYLAHCLDTLVGALAEARLLALDANGNARLAETLHFVSDLLDIIECGITALTNNPHGVDKLRSVRAEVNTLRAICLARAPNRAPHS
jgi:hypothetical protein